MREQIVNKTLKVKPMTQEDNPDYPICRECDKPAMPSGKHGVCETCCLALAEELGLPVEDRDATQIYIVPGNHLAPGKDAYRIGLFGIGVDAAPVSGPCYAPFARAVRDANGNTVITAPWGFLQVWLAEAAYFDPEAHAYSPLYAQLLWRPGKHNAFSIQGYERPHIAADEKRAKDSLAVLQGIVKRMGRPPGSTLIRDPKQVEDAYSDYIGQHGERPSQERLADHMGFSDPSTLKRFISSNMTWPPHS